MRLLSWRGADISPVREHEGGATLGLSLLLFVLAILSKSVTATLPVALLVVVWWRRGGLEWRRDVLPLLPMVVAGIAAGLTTVWFERTLIGAEGAEFEFSFVERALIAGRALWFYALSSSGPRVCPSTIRVGR